MKTLTILLLAITLFSCEKRDNILDPIKQPEVKTEPVTKVTISTFGWMQNYKLKYKRASGWCDTVINQSNYTVQYECYTYELQHPVRLYSAETYDKDTLRLKVTVNTTLVQESIVNKVEVQCLLQPNQAL